VQMIMALFNCSLNKSSSSSFDDSTEINSNEYVKCQR
jgi:hypothetical protein